MHKAMSRPALLLGAAALALAGCRSGGQAPGPNAGLGDPGAAGATGAVKTVVVDEHRFVESVQELLQGQVAGVEVVNIPQCGGITLRVRSPAPSLVGDICGREPLLIIDGKPIVAGGVFRALAGLAPSDIDRIQVLKDIASTSVYGSRGAHGVILVSTRRY